jgi:hypothetical protein
MSLSLGGRRPYKENNRDTASESVLRFVSAAPDVCSLRQRQTNHIALNMAYGQASAPLFSCARFDFVGETLIMRSNFVGNATNELAVLISSLACGNDHQSNTPIFLHHAHGCSVTAVMFSVGKLYE